MMGLGQVGNPEAGTGAQRYLCFNLGAETYAMPLLSVLEVVAMAEITPVPQTPPYFLGIINLRGQVISIVDLRVKLGLQPSHGSETAIIVCDVKPNSVGIVVDAINSVLHPGEGAVTDNPHMQSGRAAEAVRGVFRHDNKLVLLIDIAKTLGTDERHVAAAIAAAPPSPPAHVG